MRTRDEWVEQAKAKLDEWNAELDRLEGKAQSAKAEREAQYRRVIERLQGYRDEARERLEEIQRAGDDAWDDLREGLQKSWSALTEGFRAALDEFRSGGEPEAPPPPPTPESGPPEARS
ncbi:MAG: hypothetical protein GWM92_16050 [Gemmatimonadetes bacterium]|nr:hypothetical protein [Gemmatimonadota bacterium]NIR80250.1 hypothetical protein [Gemmatimonadota bacterium]NIT89012.1 hypothetical protein [Gemmatimonadota bacterium]NIU32803.1 hypothetical protein [Gemmatimonadota bacterium]NIU37231.1 hypothetical protein [Gemmatimonadota bacterium]